MKQKGFTLIELLAVIVILAIIALIAVPIILNVIDTAKKGSKESSVLGYVDAVEKQIMMSVVDSSANKIPAGTYTVEQLTELGINVKGEKPAGTSVVIIDERGRVTEMWATFEDSDYKIYYNGKYAVADKEDYIDKEGNKHNEVGTPDVVTPTIVFGGTKVEAQSGETHKGIVYLDPTDLSATCNASNSTIGSGTTGCMKFYIYDDSGDNYKMILDHNTENGVVWNASGSNVAYESSGAYTSVQNLNWTASLNPTFITTSEINTITGKTGFNSTTTNSWYYLDSLNQTKVSTTQGSSRYAWLYDYTNECTSYGCSTALADEGAYGYWTQDTVGSAGSGSRVWFVRASGNMTSAPCNHSDIGVRPVISISKSQIS